MSAIIQCLAVAAGGALGTLARFGVQNLGLLARDKFYYTLGINVVGCLLIGALWSSFNHLGASRVVSQFFIVGCLGGFTTYSTFTLDAMQLFLGGRWGEGLFYVILTLVAGFAACAAGMYGIEKLFFK